jgi:hypothetical protein
MVFLDSRSDAYFRSGLAKSAFRDAIYDNLPVDYYLPQIVSVQRLGAVSIPTSKRVVVVARPKFYQAHDAFLMYYKPYQLVLTSLKKQNKAAPAWRLIIEKAVKDPRFYDVNKITANSTELSIVAAIKFLQRILRAIDIERLQQRLQQASATQTRRRRRKNYKPSMSR